MNFKFVIFILLYANYTFAQTPASDSTAKKPRPILRSTARQAIKIDSIFPYDIALFTPDSVETNSQIALKSEGKPVLLAFWLTTCMPCMMEFEAYKKKYEAWQKETPFKLVSISTDFPQRFYRIKQVISQKGIPWEIYWDKNREFSQILPGGLNGLPQIFLFDKEGKLVWRHKGFFTGAEDEMFRQVKLVAGE